MQFGFNSSYNGHKLSELTGNLSINDSRPPSRYMTLNDILSQHGTNLNIKGKSRLHTGLGPHIQKRVLTADPCKIYHGETSPQQEINNSIYLDKISNLKNFQVLNRQGYRKTKKNPIKFKDTSVPHTEGIAEFFSPYTPFRDSFLIIRKSELGMYNEKHHRRQETSPKILKRNRFKPLSLRETLQTSKKFPLKKLAKVSLREAVRDKDWVTKAKLQISQSFYLQLNKSNGMSIQVPTDSYFTYKYYLGKGNNSKLIHQCLNNRWWWTRVSEEEKETANFVWTQWKDNEFIQTLQKITHKNAIESLAKQRIFTNVKYFDADSKPKVVDISSLGYDLITKSEHFAGVQMVPYLSSEVRMHNKIEHNFHLSNKKALFFNMKIYYEVLGKDLFQFLPVTFHIKDSADQSFADFEAYFNNIDKKSANLWIIKPGENSNRGTGISICNTIDQIKTEMNALLNSHTFIIQKYIENPFLINKRKFDIRCYALVTSFNGILQAYYFTEGYLRTASKQFSLVVTNKFVHLTNDAVQKHSEDYGKFENGNKMSYTDFQRYLDSHHPEKAISFLEEVIPKIKEIIIDSIKAVSSKLDPHQRAHTFELFGYDFLLDSDLKPWLLEVNTNPCLELSSPHLVRIIPSLIENALRVCIDPIFQEPGSFVKHSMGLMDLPENKFELIFNSQTTDQGLSSLLRSDMVYSDENL